MNDIPGGNIVAGKLSAALQAVSGSYQGALVREHAPEPVISSGESAQPNKSSKLHFMH